MRKLFVDIEISGHHTEYIGHLFQHLAQNEVRDNIFFLVHYEFKSRFIEIYNLVKYLENVHVIEISHEEYRKAKSGNLILQSFMIYRLLNVYVLRFKIEKVILLQFNIFQLPFSLFRQSYKISGILFLQFFRMSKVSLMENLKYYRKFTQTWLFTQNPNIQEIFILNDEKTVCYLNSKFKSKIFKTLPDPIQILKPKPGLDIRKSHNISQNRTIFLHIGKLHDRKGTFDILDSLLLLNKNIFLECAFFFIGKADTKDEKKIESKIRKVRSNSPDAQIIYRNEFLEKDEMKSYFVQSDYILIPYKNVESSSGILGHAISSNKPVIGSGNGLLGEMILQNNAGIGLNIINSTTIAKAIHQIYQSSYTFEKSHLFIKTHSPSLFSKNLIK